MMFHPANYSFYPGVNQHFCTRGTGIGCAIQSCIFGRNAKISGLNDCVLFGMKTDTTFFFFTAF
jgi:hypothetical protein